MEAVINQSHDPAGALTINKNRVGLISRHNQTNSVCPVQLHRVLLPPVGDSRTRQSVAFFVQPDDDAVISCVDGSNRYPPVSSSAYLQQRFRDSYRHE